MKFPRNARMLKGQQDFAPYASVFFCLLIFVLLSSLVYLPGVPINLPGPFPGLPVADVPMFAVTLAPNGTFYYKQQSISEKDLSRLLRQEAAKYQQPLTLGVIADKNEKLTSQGFLHLVELARAAGVTKVSLLALPGTFEEPAGTKVK